MSCKLLILETTEAELYAYSLFFTFEKMASAEDVNHTQNSESEAPKLTDLLDRGWKLYEEVDTTNEPTGSNPIQVKVKRGIMQLEEATRMVAQLDLFR